MEIPSIAKSEGKHMNTSFALLTNEIDQSLDHFLSITLPTSPLYKTMPTCESGFYQEINILGRNILQAFMDIS